MFFGATVILYVWQEKEVWLPGWQSFAQDHWGKGLEAVIREQSLPSFQHLNTFSK
jgi:hypothetical protein